MKSLVFGTISCSPASAITSPLVTKPSRFKPLANDTDYPYITPSPVINTSGFKAFTGHPPQITPSPITHTSCFRPFSDDPDLPPPRWQSDIDEYIRSIFSVFILWKSFMINEAAAKTLQLVGNPTKLKMRGLAMACFAQWLRLQSDSGDVNTGADKVSSFIGCLCHWLNRVSVRARLIFEDELSALCIDKLRLTWRCIMHANEGKSLLSREWLLVRITALVPILGHLYRGGHVQQEVVVHTLQYLSTFFPLPDALQTFNAILLGIGPAFLSRGGCKFLHDILTELQGFTLGRSPLDRFCQLAGTTQRLAKEWQLAENLATFHPTYRCQIML